MKKKSDDLFSIAVLFQIITSVVQLILPLTGFMTVDQAAVMRIVVTVCTFLPAIILLFLYHRQSLIVLFLLYFSILLINYLFFPTSEKFITSYQAWTLTPISILTVLCMYNIKNYGRFWKLLLYSSWLCAFLAVVYFVLFTFSPFRDTNSSYSMHFGYTLLLPIMYLFARSNIVDGLLSIMMLGIVLLIASRGAAGMALLFYVMFIIFFNRKMIVKLAIIIIILAPILFSELPKFIDIESARTISLILRGEVGSHDSGRSDIYKIVESKISERPITGWGIGADREILDTFSHNLILELSLHYGILITIVISIVLLIHLLQSFNPFRAQRIGGGVFIVMLALYGLLPLMVSNSYLIDYKFATFIGALYRTFRKGY